MGGGTLVAGTVAFGGGRDGGTRYSCTVGKPPFRSWSREKRTNNSCTLPPLTPPPPTTTTIPYRKGARVSVSHVCFAYIGAAMASRSPQGRRQVPEDARSIKTFCNNPLIRYYCLLPSFVILNALSLFVIKRLTIYYNNNVVMAAVCKYTTTDLNDQNNTLLISYPSSIDSEPSRKPQNVFFFSRPHTKTYNTG